MTVSAAAVVLTLALWLASGRASLTKSARNVTVEVRDELFGDVTTREDFERGPIFGYFIGLDAVTVVAGTAVVASGLAWFLTRKRVRSEWMEARRQT